MKRWEYCIIVGASDSGQIFNPIYPTLIFFTPNGYGEVEELGKKYAKERPEGMRNVSEAGYVASIIAKLGLEGWELVNAVTGANMTGNVGATSLYFKREI